jgi:hypothetical protein
MAKMLFSTKKEGSNKLLTEYLEIVNDILPTLKCGVS